MHNDCFFYSLNIQIKEKNESIKLINQNQNNTLRLQIIKLQYVILSIINRFIPSVDFLKREKRINILK